MINIYHLKLDKELFQVFPQSGKHHKQPISIRKQASKGQP